MLRGLRAVWLVEVGMHQNRGGETSVDSGQSSSGESNGESQQDGRESGQPGSRPGSADAPDVRKKGGNE